MTQQILITDIKEGAKFKCDTGIVWCIDKLEQHETAGTLVSTSMEHGKKGNYRDDIKTVVDFLNEENAEKL